MASEKLLSDWPIIALSAAVMFVGLSCEGEKLRQIPPNGDVEGYLCDTTGDNLAEGVVVSAEGVGGTVSAVSDDRGYFLLSAVLAGNRSLVLNGGGYEGLLLDVEVVADTLVSLPPPPCLAQATGAVHGTVCAGDAGGFPVPEALVRIVVTGLAPFEATTDVDGEFTLTDVPIGTHILEVEKGAFRTSQSVVIEPRITTELGSGCLPPTSNIAVFTGAFDRIEDVLAELGFLLSGCAPSTLDAASLAFDCGSTATSGTLQLIDAESDFFVRDVLLESTVLDGFDVLFFNCGIADVYLASAPAAVGDNLRAFVSAGGGLYASDYAYELLRQFFSGSVAFYGDDAVAGAAKKGAENLLASGFAQMPALVTAVGAEALPLSFDKANWVVLDAVQPDDVQVWVVGDVSVDDNGDTISDQTFADHPLIVSTPFGEGNIVFTSFHTHANAGEAVHAVLRQMIFEL